MTRNVDAEDLRLFAINTGELYKTHLRLVTANVAVWESHVRSVVVRYSREIEPVKASAETVTQVAKALREYYIQHKSEF